MTDSIECKANECVKALQCLPEPSDPDYENIIEYNAKLLKKAEALLNDNY